MTDEDAVEGQPLPSSRALVFVDRRRKVRALPRAAADFLAQLIASDRHLGEFRRARRRDPAAGIGEYQTVDTPTEPAFQRNV